MLIIGDHTKYDKIFKHETYLNEKPNQNKTYTTYNKRKLLQTDPKRIMNLNYSIWLKTLNKDRINYLKQIGIKDFNKLIILSKLSFNILPYDIRSKLQTTEIIIQDNK